MKLSTGACGDSISKGAGEMLSLLRRWVEVTDADFARLCLEDEWEAKNVIRNYPEPDGVNAWKVFNQDIAKGLPGVYWATYFGRSFVDWIGEEVIGASPWPHVQKYANGYLLLRSESPAMWRDETELDSRLRRHLGGRRFFDISAPQSTLDILELEIPDYYSSVTAEPLAGAPIQAKPSTSQAKPVRRRRLPARQAPALIERLSFFRRMGFFAEFGDRPDGDVARELYELQMEKWGTGFIGEGPMADLELLAWDRKRVWWEDTEADIGPGNRVYESVLRQWAKISRGAFEPIDVSESWGSESGPVRVSFTFRGTRLAVTARYLDDYLDLSIVRQINAIISDTQLAYEVFEEFDQTAFVVVLNAAHRALLETERAWRFRELQPPAM
ncbi:MAG TPA: hypothetical protein VG826_25830 [Pirellulales bacterium]|nr:hypothetical protein [Pirellulales bacterium]